MRFTAELKGYFRPDCHHSHFHILYKDLWVSDDLEQIPPVFERLWGVADGTNMKFAWKRPDVDLFPEK